MDAQAYEITRAEAAPGTGDLDSARGFALALVLSLAGWVLVIALLFKGIF